MWSSRFPHLVANRNEMLKLLGALFVAMVISLVGGMYSALFLNGWTPLILGLCCGAGAGIFFHRTA